VVEEGPAGPAEATEEAAVPEGEKLPGEEDKPLEALLTSEPTEAPELVEEDAKR
jgi:hypothetical protein